MNEQPNKQALARTSKDVRALIQSEQFKSQIAMVLPKHVTPERMTRVALTALLKTPALLECSQESLLNALLVCSQAGLEPDGRLAHLIPYGKVVQVIFDYKGLVTLALRNGAESVYADKVCEADFFEACVEDGIKRLTHKPDYRKARGEAVCYYAVCKRNKEVDWEVMTKEDVDAIRNRSRAKANGPWVTDYDEMAKKTVLRRMSKRWDLLPEIREVMYQDDDTPQDIDQRAKLAKPLFETPEAPAPEAPAGATEKAPEQSGAELAAVRALCKKDNVTEGRVMEWLAKVGMTDGSPSSLDEVPVIVLKALAEKWDEALREFKPAREGGLL
jgi:recombination protein RecT